MEALPVFDKEGALKRVDNDLSLYRELIEIFLQDYPRYMQELRDAHGRGNADLAGRTAHAIKSALGNLGASDSCAAAYAIERAGKEGRLIDIGSLTAEMDAKIQKFLLVIRRFLEEENFPL